MEEMPNGKTEEKAQELHHMVLVEDLGGLKRRLNVSYDNVGVRQALELACGVVSKQAQVKGFRRGKAPKQLVERMLAKEIRQVASSMLTENAFQMACMEQKLRPIEKPTVDQAGFSIEGDTFECSISVDVSPSITPTGYVGMQLRKVCVDREELFQNILGNARVQHATHMPVDIVTDGCTVMVDFCARVGAEEVSHGTDQGFSIRKGQEPPFGENLIGTKVGETRTENVVLPETMKEHGGAMARVNVTVKRASVSIPPTDEELAIRAQAPSFDELVKVMRQHADMEASRRERQVLEEGVVDNLVSSHDFELPEKWVDDEEKFVVRQLGLKEEVPGDLKDHIRKMAERNVRRAFVLDAVCDAEPSLAVTKEELEDTISKEAQHSGKSVLEVKEEIMKKGLASAVVSAVRQRKVMDFILAQAQYVTDAPVIVAQDEPQQPAATPEQQ